ncbi:MAG TPA: phosphatase PAP2 family protein [Flavobacterium sp.]|nr:phosphatase PAP2 family protein [Flavobacterium sp.]
MNQKKINKLYQHFGLVLLFLAPLLLLPKGFIEMRWNLFEYPQLFLAFKIITLFGDGWMLLAVLIFTLVRLHFYKRRKNLKDLYFFIFSAVISILIVSILKNLVFHDALRPMAYFDIKNSSWDTSIFDIRFNRRRSFPSGHTATFATIAFFLMRFAKKTIYIKLLFLAIVLVGFSRIFLFQHFVLDVFIGMYIALFSVTIGNKLSRFVLSKKKIAKTTILNTQ